MLSRRPPSPLRTTPRDLLLGPPLGDQLAGSRLLAERFAAKRKTVPPFAVDLLSQGRRLDTSHAEPETEYERIARAFYRREIDAQAAVAALNELFDIDADRDTEQAVDARRSSTVG
jgi:hypothetical protein